MLIFPNVFLAVQHERGPRKPKLHQPHRQLQQQQTRFIKDTVQPVVSKALPISISTTEVSTVSSYTFHNFHQVYNNIETTHKPRTPPSSPAIAIPQIANSPELSPLPVTFPASPRIPSRSPSSGSSSLLDVSTFSPKRTVSKCEIDKCTSRSLECFPNSINCYQQLYGCYFHHHHHHHHHHHDYHYHHHHHHHHQHQLNDGQPSISSNSENGTDGDNSRSLIRENDYLLSDNQKLLSTAIQPKDGFSELPIQPLPGYCGSPFFEFLITSENCQVRSYYYFLVISVTINYRRMDTTVDRADLAKGGK